MKLHNMVKLTTKTLLVSIFATTFSATAEESRFREAGQVTAYDRESMTVVIGESTYKLDPATRIYAPSGQLLPLDVLKSGQSVRFNLTMVPNERRPILKDALLLPAK